MVGPLTIIKVLHCKSISIKQERNTDFEKSLGHGRRSVTGKIDVYKNICRVCLKEGKIPIYSHTSNDLSHALHTFGNIEMSANDPFPKNLCHCCYSLLKGAILLRKTAEKSDRFLRQPIKGEVEPKDHFNGEDNISENGMITNDNDTLAETSEHEYDLNTKNGKTNEPKSYGKKIKKKCSNMPSIQKINQKVSGRKVNLKIPNTNEQKNKLQDAVSNKHENFKCTSPVQEEPNIISCQKCQLQFNTLQEYDEHRLSDEHENKKIQCPICEKSYHQQYLNKHLITHSQDVRYMCDICGKNFKFQSPCARHRLTHFISLPYQCSLCPYKGRFSESLKMHMRTHSGDKPYQCTQCPHRKFINKSNLNRHMLIHRGMHDFRCDMCGRGYYTKRELEAHFKVDHSGIKEHKCIYCDKSFGYRKALMKHERRVHKREKFKSGRLPLYLKLEKMKQQTETAESSNNMV